MGTASEEGAPEPRNNPYLLGREAAEKAFLEAWKNNTLHNSWIISGQAGIGKATLAYRIARFLLCADEGRRSEYASLEVAPGSAAFKLVANGAHPDLKVIERGYSDTDRRKIAKAIKDGEPLSDGELRGMKKSANIKVDDVREINEFLSKRSADGNWRAVIVDSVDEMNSASANAILKVLEEPPLKAIMLLVSHNPNRLLPTIKSRCAKMALKPLGEAEVSSLLRRYRPGLEEKAVKEAARLAGGSIGKAIVCVDFDAAGLYAALSKAVYARDAFKLADLLAFADKASGGEGEYGLAKELVLKIIKENAASSPGMMEAFDLALSTFAETDGLNMDRKQALMKVVTAVCRRI